MNCQFSRLFCSTWKTTFSSSTKNGRLWRIDIVHGQDSSPLIKRRRLRLYPRQIWSNFKNYRVLLKDSSNKVLCPNNALPMKSYLKNMILLFLRVQSLKALSIFLLCSLFTYEGLIFYSNVSRLKKQKEGTPSMQYVHPIFS